MTINRLFYIVITLLLAIFCLIGYLILDKIDTANKNIVIIADQLKIDTIEIN